jgi:hypothetical protein
MNARRISWNELGRSKLRRFSDMPRGKPFLCTGAASSRIEAREREGGPSPPSRALGASVKALRVAVVVRLSGYVPGRSFGHAPG